MDKKTISDTAENSSNIDTMPVLPLRDVVVFPQMVVPLFVGRKASVAALDAAMARDTTEKAGANLRSFCCRARRNETRCRNPRSATARRAPVCP